MSAPQPPPMFPKAYKHKKAIETWKFRFTPMFSEAMKPLWCPLALDKVAQPPPVQPELQQPAKVVVVRLVPGKGTGTE